jgi:rare lipoprotein A
MHLGFLMRNNSCVRATKNVIWKFVLPSWRTFFVFQSVHLAGYDHGIGIMKQRVLVSTASLAIATCLLLLPACRKHHRVAKNAPAPQPSHVRLPRQLSKPTSSQTSRKPVAVPVGYTEEGIASWYGVPYHGRQAADGEIYDMETLVAAHRVMPFNTWLKITNLANNKSVNVRIIDRGPFVEGRIIDLSNAAARQIGLLGPGIGRVRLEVTGAPPDIPSNDFYAVQVGAFSVAANAEHVRMQYAQRFGTAQLALKQGAVPLWRVLIGKEPSIAAAQELADVLSAENRAVFVVRLDETVVKAGTSIVPGLIPETMR